MNRSPLDSFGFSSLRKRQSRRSHTLRHQPGFERLEDRCLLTTYTTAPSFTPVAEMVCGPVGDIWFSRIQDLSITRIDSSGTLTEFGTGATTQPLNLEVDANDNLWFTAAANPPANHLFRVTPAGVVTEATNYYSSFQAVSQDPTQPVLFLTHGHINDDNSGLLVGVKADGSLGFYPLYSSDPVGPNLYGGRPLSVAVQPAVLYNGVSYETDFWYTDDHSIGEAGVLGDVAHYPLPDPNDVAASIALGGDGNIWFVENSIHVSPTADTYYVADKIGKITPDGTMTTYDVKLAGFRLQIGPLVPGSDGSLWFNQVGVEEDGSNPEPNTHRIGRISPTGSISRYIPPDSAAGATAMLADAVSPSGGVTDSPWFTTTPFNPQASAVEVHAFSELTPVPATNVAPVAVNDSYRVAPGASLSVARAGVLANDTDANYDPLRAILVTGTTHGTLSLNLNGAFTYNPNAGYIGPDSFTYQASDGLLQSNTATVTITVVQDNNDPPPPAQLPALANTITHSVEHAAQFVTAAYQQFLGRSPDTAGLNAWVGALQSGLSDEQVEARVVSSAEYLGKYDGAGSAWVQGLYFVLLNRTPAQAEVNGWVAALAGGVKPQTVAFDFSAGRERESKRVRADYQTLLGRTPEASEVDGWVNGFAAGLSNEILVADFLSSFEYYNDPVKGNANNRDWITSATRDALARPATDTEINSALGSLLPAKLPQAAAQITHSAEQYQLFVTSVYQTFLSRTPDTAGLNAWVAGMQNGLSDEHVEASFLSSPEYLNAHGGAGAAWVTNLYQTVLNRTPSTVEVQGWVTALGAGVSPQTVAGRFATGVESEALQVRAAYFTYLGRTPGQPEVNAWLTAFTHGLTDEDLAASFLASPEYYNSTVKGTSNPVNWLTSAILDVLHRPATAADFNTYGAVLQ